MRGFLKTKHSANQLLILISIALVSAFLIGAVGTLIVSKIAGVSVLSMADMSKIDYSDPKTIFMLRGLQVVQFLALFVIPVFLCAWMFSTNTKEYLGLKMPANSGYWLMGIIIMIVSIPLITWLGELNRHVQFPAGIESWMKKSEADAQRAVEALLSKRTIKDLIINIICIAGLAAVGEELLFRGMAQRLFIKWFRNPWAGIIVAAILFSALHLQFYGFLPRFVLGVFLGVAFWYSGSLWVAILGHFVYDAVIIVLAYAYPEMMDDEKAAQQISNLALAGAISAALVALIIVWMKKKSTANYAAVYADDAIPVKDHPF
jgi:uncharacterized protein